MTTDSNNEVEDWTQALSSTAATTSRQINAVRQFARLLVGAEHRVGRSGRVVS